MNRIFVQTLASLIIGIGSSAAMAKGTLLMDCQNFSSPNNKDGIKIYEVADGDFRVFQTYDGKLRSYRSVGADAAVVYGLSPEGSLSGSSVRLRLSQISPRVQNGNPDRYLILRDVVLKGGNVRYSFNTLSGSGILQPIEQQRTSSLLNCSAEFRDPVAKIANSLRLKEESLLNPTEAVDKINNGGLLFTLLSPESRAEFFPNMPEFNFFYFTEKVSIGKYKLGNQEGAFANLTLHINLENSDGDFSHSCKIHADTDIMRESRFRRIKALGDRLIIALDGPRITTPTKRDQLLLALTIVDVDCAPLPQQ